MNNTPPRNMPTEMEPVPSMPRDLCRERKASGYYSVNHEVIAFETDKLKCRKRLAIALRDSPDSAHIFCQAMIEVGIAAAVALGDAQTVVSLLEHFRRLIRSGHSLDF